MLPASGPSLDIFSQAVIALAHLAKWRPCFSTLLPEVVDGDVGVGVGVGGVCLCVCFV